MFSCFTSKKVKKSSKLKQENKIVDSNENEIEELLKRKKIENDDLIIDNESFKLQIYFLEETLANYKKLLIDLNNEKNRRLANNNLNENLMKVMTKENFDNKHQFEILNASVNSLHVNLNELLSTFEQSPNREESKLQKIIYNEFILRNLCMKKENEIFNLENYLKSLKNFKKTKKNIEGLIFLENLGDIVPGELIYNLRNNNQDAYFNSDQLIQNRMNKEEDILLKKIQGEELENSRYNYQKITKQTINLKTTVNKSLNKIEELQKEIDYIKNPNYLQLKNSVGLSETSKNNLNTMPSSNGNVVLKLYEIKENQNEMIKLNEELNSNKNKIQVLQEELENQKKLNDKIENEISILNNQLSDKFSTIFKLEMKLDKLKSRKKDKRKETKTQAA